MADSWPPSFSFLQAVNYCLQAVDTSGKSKDADYLFNLHKDLVQELHQQYAPITLDTPDTEVQRATAFRNQFLGTVMDNTSANMAASARLEEAFGTWLCLGCLAHALNLLFKDLARLRDVSDGEEGERPKKKAKKAKVSLMVTSVLPSTPVCEHCSWWTDLPSQ